MGKHICHHKDGQPRFGNTVKCPPADECMKKQWYVYTLEYYASVKKKDLLPFASAWMDLEIIMLSEKKQSVKDKYHMISLICGL